MGCCVYRSMQYFKQLHVLTIVTVLLFFEVHVQNVKVINIFCLTVKLHNNEIILLPLCKDNIHTIQYDIIITSSGRQW